MYVTLTAVVKTNEKFLGFGEVEETETLDFNNMPSHVQPEEQKWL